MAAKLALRGAAAGTRAMDDVTGPARHGARDSCIQQGGRGERAVVPIGEEIE